MDACDVNNDGAIGCSDDCSGRKFCLSGKLHILDCYKQTRHFFCDPETLGCVTTKVPCKKLNYKFTCPDKGYYPDAFNCTKYFICNESNILAYHGSCKNKELVYNPKLQICESNISCYNFTSNGLCHLKDETIQVHPLDERFYFLCSEKSHVLKTCPEEHVFNTFTLKCEKACLKAGTFADRDDHKCYYKCVATSNGFEKTYYCCDKNSFFSEEYGTCLSILLAPY